MTNPQYGDVCMLVSSMRRGEFLLFENPKRLLAASDSPELEKALTELEDGVSNNLWAAGFLSYELGYLLEEHLAARYEPNPSLPQLLFGLFEEPQRLSREEVDDWISSNAGSYRFIKPPEANTSREDYTKRFNKVKSYISAGDIYQLNLTFKAKFQLSGSPLGLHRDLRNKQPVDHGAFLKGEDFSILSISPELFLKREGDILRTRPMKGTEPRGETAELDQAAKDRLKLDEKQRAENLMIVDLMRNDISRVCEVGSVKVPDLFTVETYPTLHQMTSTVEGKLLKDTTFKDVIKALFPAGSITGAPKIRAMELINDLESEPRGIYCGSIGYVNPERDINLNVAIRTLTILKDGHGEIGIGSGVVADSEADKEYDEALLKMRFLKDAVMNFQLFETMLFIKDKGIWLIDEHMERLQRSAKQLGFSFDPDQISKQLNAHLEASEGDRLRVRLVLSKDGNISIVSAELPSFDVHNPAEIKFVISPSRIKSDDFLLNHKTTNRALYDDEFALYNKEVGAEEVLYLNEKDELAEGSRTNLFLQIDGKLLTPPLRCGLLPGTLRARLLRDGKAKEAVLKMDDLEKAERIYLGNSVRGLQPAILMGR